jgi:hypothetical protein
MGSRSSIYQPASQRAPLKGTTRQTGVKNNPNAAPQNVLLRTISAIPLIIKGFIILVKGANIGVMLWLMSLSVIELAPGEPGR